jgi:hypothetical protein
MTSHDYEEEMPLPTDAKVCLAIEAARRSAQLIVDARLETKDEEDG